MLYNIPGRTAKNIEPDTIARMAEMPNITMIKAIPLRGAARRIFTAGGSSTG